MKPLIPKNWREIRDLPPRCARFELDQDEEGFWRVYDQAYMLVLGGYATKKEAADLKSFANEYVKWQGDIDFNSFPYTLTQPLHYCDADEVQRYWQDPENYVESEMPGWSPV